MDTTLSATSRTADFGKGEARKLRASGRLPAVIYGREGQTANVALDPFALTEIFRHSQSRNTVLYLAVDDAAPQPCLVRDVQRHPVERTILHVDFYKLDMEHPVEVMVPVTTEGRAAGAVLGGRIRIIRRELPVRCTYDRIPEQIAIDVTPLHIDDIVKSSQIVLPEGVSLRLDADVNVVSCYGKRVVAAKVAAPEKKGKK